MNNEGPHLVKKTLSSLTPLPPPHRLLDHGSLHLAPLPKHAAQDTSSSPPAHDSLSIIPNTFRRDVCPSPLIWRQQFFWQTICTT